MRTALASLASAALLLVAEVPAAPAYQAVFDVEDPCFEIIGGLWTLRNDAQRLAYYYFTTTGPGTGEGRVRWIAEGLPAGTYLIEHWVAQADYPSDARFQVISADGVSDLQVDMNHLTNGWHPIGTFDVERTCVVNLSDHWEGAGTLLGADALRFTLTSSLPPPPPTSVPPHIGLCIDDVGAANPLTPTTPIHQMLRLPFAMTYAVLPLRTYTAESAEEIHRLGSEVILHQPMAAITIPDPGAGGISDTMTLDQVRATIAANLDALPHVAGMNNHTGSLVTQRADKMAACMEVLEARDLYFFDSRTFTLSVAFDEGRRAGLFTAERDIFIDGNSQAEAMALIRALALRALHAPEIPHLGIGHVRSGTSAALAAMVPELESMGVEVWPVSRCLSEIVEAGVPVRGTSIETAGSWTSEERDAHSHLLRDGEALAARGSGEHRARFAARLNFSGVCDVYAIWPSDASGEAGATARIAHLGGSTAVPIDQSQGGDTWHHLGQFSFSREASAEVTVEAASPEGTLWADAVRFDWRGPLPDPVGQMLR